MLKRSKSITIICSIMIGVVFALVMLLIMTVTGVIRLGQNTLVIETESFEAKYDGTPLTNYTWKIADGKLKDGHTIEVNFTGSQTNVGESNNTVEVTIRDELGTDVTSDYKIQYNYGLLKVNPRTIAISTPSATKAFDGMPLTNLKYEVAEDFDGLVRGHFIKALVTGYQIEVGESANTMSEVEIYDFFGADVTGNYRIVVREGTLMVYSPDGLGGGSGSSDNFGGGALGEMDPETVLYQVYAQKTANIYLREASYGDYNGKGFDEAAAYESLIEEEFSAMYLTSFALEGNMASSYDLKIKAFYDIYVVPYYLSASNNVHAVQSSDIASVGDTSEEWTVSYYEAPTASLTVPMYRAYELNYRSFVYENYTAVDDETRNFMNGIIESEGLNGSSDIFATIEQVAAYIQSAAAYNLEYNTAMELEDNVAIAFLDTYKEGVCRHYAMAATLMFRTMGIPARYTVGILAKAEANEWTDVKAANAHAWVEVYVDGMGWVMVEVTGSSSGAGGGSGGNGGGEIENKPKLEIKPENVSKKYDGTELVAGNDVTGTTLNQLLTLGYSYEAVVTGSRTELGKTTSRIVSFKLYNSAGEDVTSEFDITYQTGTVHVYYSTLKFKSYDDSKVYGEDVNKQVDFLGGELMSGHRYEITVTATYNAGTSLNTYKVQVFDGETDVSDWYKLDRTYGTLVISHREITVKAKDATKKYDGTELTCNEIEYDRTQLATGDTITAYEVVGSQLSSGHSNNEVVIGSVKITDSNGNDVTSNYEIKLVAGELRITRT